MFLRVFISRKIQKFVQINFLEFQKHGQILNKNIQSNLAGVIFSKLIN